MMAMDGRDAMGALELEIAAVERWLRDRPPVAYGLVDSLREAKEGRLAGLRWCRRQLAAAREPSAYVVERRYRATGSGGLSHHFDVQDAFRSARSWCQYHSPDEVTQHPPDKSGTVRFTHGEKVAVVHHFQPPPF